MPDNQRGGFRNQGDQRSVGDAFADPNAIDDQKLGASFIEMNSSAKKNITRRTFRKLQ